jgi:hypothetical protein
MLDFFNLGNGGDTVKARGCIRLNLNLGGTVMNTVRTFTVDLTLIRVTEIG